MKNYLLSFLYSLFYLAIFGLGFWGLSAVLDAKTYQTVVTTVSFFCIGMSFFLCIWFGQDELFFLLFLNLILYAFAGYLRPNIIDTSTYSHLIIFPLICWILPITIYSLLKLTSDNSFIYPFSKKLLILFSEVLLVYFFTYLIPTLLGRPFFTDIKNLLASVLYFPFDKNYHFPMMSFVPFVLCLLLLICQKTKRSTQIQTSLTILFFSMFFSLFCIQSLLFFELFYISSFTTVLFLLLQVSHRMAFLDELTNMPGRRALMTELKHLEKEDYTLAMIDIDFFKRLNDSYGHEVGDQALRTISATLSQHSEEGTLYRYGGEEFVLLFPHRKLDEILDNMEGTRVLVSNSDFFLRPKKNSSPNNQPYLASIHITLSAGVAQKMPGQTYDEVINIADKALYKAKQTGRNKTVYNKNGKFFELF